MNDLIALWRGRPPAHANIEEGVFHDREGLAAVVAYFDHELAREGCLTPENCTTHVYERCGQQRPEVMQAIANERHRILDPRGFAEMIAARDRAAAETAAAKERKLAERRARLRRDLAERKARRALREALAIAEAPARE